MLYNSTTTINLSSSTFSTSIPTFFGIFFFAYSRITVNQFYTIIIVCNIISVIYCCNNITFNYRSIRFTTFNKWFIYILIKIKTNLLKRFSFFTDIFFTFNSIFISIYSFNYIFIFFTNIKPFLCRLIYIINTSIST